LVGMIGLQAYYGWQVYQQQSLALRAEVDVALKAAVEKAHEQRVERIHTLFERDLQNPDLVTVELRMTEEGPKIVTLDPQTGTVYMKLTYPKDKSLPSSPEEIKRYLVKRNRAFLAEGTFMYWNPALGERLESYVDTIYHSKTYLAKQLERELIGLGIRGEFGLMYGIEDSWEQPHSKQRLYSSPVDVHLKSNYQVKAILHHPGFEIMKRMGLVLGLTGLVLLLILLSFSALWYIIHRQKRLSALKDDFIDNVTHELLTPIATLKLALESLSKDPKVQPSSYLDISTQQAQRIAEVVDHVLQVSFIEEEKAGIRLEAVDLVTLIQEVTAYHQATSPKPLNLSLELPFEVTVWSDRHHLSNVLHNVLGNAIKYGPESGVDLLIGHELVGEAVVLQIWDNGLGIPLHEQEKIFEKFHRVPTGDTHEVKGLGIGLYYVRSILRQMGGEISLTQSSPEGSCFEIMLPLPQIPA
ncbi:MAG: HAMP domain-containing sensor histidine kinase, partial [Bacteroidota bacterium]